MNATQYAELFLTESREHVAAVNRWLLELERGAGGTEPLDAIFRAVHTVKGMSATMGYGAVTELSHELESLLDRLRRRELVVSPRLMDALFGAADLLEGAIETSVAGHGDDIDVAATIARLRHAAQGASGSMRAIPATPIAGIAMTSVPARPAAPPATGWTIPSPQGAGRLVRLRIAHDAPLRGVRAFMAVQAARKLGEVTAIAPPPEQFDGEGFGDEVAIRVVTELPAAEIERTIRAVGDVVEVVVDAAEAAPTPAPTEAASAPAAPAVEAQRQHFVRIDLRRLDSLMNLIGELVIARGRLAQIASASGEPELAETVEQASRLVAELQDEIITSRLAPVWQIFDRFPRLVRDAARTLGKQVELTVEGKDIELDRSMLDEIGDPIVHLLRNAVDHGIESPEVRVAAGKPAAGRLRLEAVRDRSAVAIRVSDDGRGIDRGRVLAKAKAAGLVPPEQATLGDDEMLRLISRSGFSTAERVTDVSGRGVGMDAVYNKVRSLGGSVDVRTSPGQGTTVALRLPLTLAIVRALLARVGEESYAIPMTHVRETVEVEGDVLQRVQGREVLVLRDEVLPVVRLRERVRLEPAPAGLAEQAVVIEMADRQAALVVDELTMQQEIVVKQFDTVKDAPPLFGGATILGDGAPALILDVGSLL